MPDHSTKRLDITIYTWTRSLSLLLISISINEIQWSILSGSHNLFIFNLYFIFLKEATIYGRWCDLILNSHYPMQTRYWSWVVRKQKLSNEDCSYNSKIQNTLTLRKCLVAKKREESVSCAFAHCSANGVNASKQSWQTSELILSNKW